MEHSINVLLNKWMESGNNNIIYLVRLLRGLNEKMQFKRLAEDVTQSKRQEVGVAEMHCFCCSCHCVVSILISEHPSSHHALI